MVAVELLNCKTSKMKDILNLLVIIAFFSIGYGCSNDMQTVNKDNKEESEVDKLQLAKKNIELSLLRWNLNANTNIFKSSDSLTVRINFTDSVVYHGKSTNGTIASLLLFENDQYFDDASYVKFEMNLLFYNYSITVGFSNPQDFKINRQKFNSEKYVKNVQYSLEKLTYEEIAAFESVTKYLNEKLDGEYHYSDYWILLAELDEYAFYSNENFKDQADLFDKVVFFQKKLTMPGCTDESYAKFNAILESYGMRKN